MDMIQCPFDSFKLNCIMSKPKLSTKGIKNNAFRNGIDVNFVLWINNVYIYVWPCCMHLIILDSI